MLGSRRATPSISTKLTRSLVFANVAGLVVASLAFVLLDRPAWVSGIGRRLEAEGAFVAAAALAPLRAGDAAGAQQALAPLVADARIQAAAIYDSRGRRFASREGKETPMALPIPEGVVPALRVEAERIALVHPIVGKTGVAGFVYLEADTSELQERLYALGTIALGVFLLAPIVGLALSSRLQRRITRPLRELAAVARLVSSGENYSVRAAPGGSDETGLLVLAFNQMLARVQQRDASLTAEIAERERTQAELRRARDAAEAARLREESARRAAEQASAVKSAFLANMSHEIRTPLNVILGYNSLIQQSLEEAGDPEQIPLIEGVARASKRLMTTVHGILDISRIESGAFDVHPAPIRVNPFVSRLVEDYRVLASAKGLTLDFVGAPDDVTIVFDEYCLSHSLTNLLDNAIKFTAKGGITVSVRRSRDHGVEIEIADTGIGMDAEYVARIAEPFSQAEFGSTRKFDGAGLGLALTKRFLETHDATFTVTSTKGQGSAFVIHVPSEWVIEGDAASDEEVVAAGNGGSAKGTDPGVWAKPCVLVVEDDPDTQDLMRVILSERYRVIVASSGADARRKLAFPGRSVRLVLMDLSLSGDEDGLMLTRALRADERWRTLPIVAVTAHAFPADRENALGSGCDAYLAKPVERTRLLSVVQGFTG